MRLRWRAKEAGRWLLAPAVLVAIAAVQVALVQTQNLTPWKGGGFGMFSTDRTGANRTVRAYLVKGSGADQQQLAVELPRELGRWRIDARQTPTRDSALALAERLAVLPWLEPAEVEEMAAQGPEAVLGQAMAQGDSTAAGRAMKRLLSLPRVWPGGLASTRRYGDGRPVDFDQVVVEIWELRFDAAASAMRAERLVEVSSAPPWGSAWKGGAS
jgi:hypothetical protein